MVHGLGSDLQEENPERDQDVSKIGQVVADQTAFSLILWKSMSAQNPQRTPASTVISIVFPPFFVVS
jgi:hypothetical protein